MPSFYVNRYWVVIGKYILPLVLYRKRFCDSEALIVPNSCVSKFSVFVVFWWVYERTVLFWAVVDASFNFTAIVARIQNRIEYIWISPEIKVITNYQGVIFFRLYHTSDTNSVSSQAVAWIKIQLPEEAVVVQAIPDSQQTLMVSIRMWFKTIDVNPKMRS